MENKSSIEQTIEFDEIPKPSKKSFKLWREFAVWMKAQEIMIIFHFESKIIIRYTMTKDGKYSREQIDKIVAYYAKDEIKYS